MRTDPQRGNRSSGAIEVRTGGAPARRPRNSPGDDLAPSRAKRWWVRLHKRPNRQKLSARVWCAALAITASLCLGGTPTPSKANSIQTDFPALWANFIALCGQLVLNPASSFANPPRLPNLPHFGWAKNEDDTVVSGHFLESIDLLGGHLLEFHLVRKNNGFALSCNAEHYNENGYDLTNGPQLIRQMIEQGGAMALSGGLYRDLPGGTSPYLEGLDGPSFAYVVNGAFPGTDIVVDLNLDQNGLAITLTTSLTE